MRRLSLAGLAVASLIAIAVTPLAAHHDVAAYYDVTRPASISGVIVELRAVNPHAVLIVDGPGPDGRTGRWAFEGLPPNAYQYRGLEDYKARLNPGTRITISGWTAKDPQARAFWANTITFADGTTMVFGSTTLEGGHWRCANPPCQQSYAYPGVQ
jgi:hypothetical protein